MRGFKLTAAMATAALTASNCAFAQHSDVEFTYAGDKIAVEFGDEGRVFEGDFSDLVGGLNATDAPGFGSEIAEGLGVGPDDIIGYNVVGPLVYHDGVAFSPTDAMLTVENGVGDDVIVDSATTSASGLIGQADSAGDFHGHIDFAISEGAATGAYGLLLTLSSFDAGGQPQGIADSDRFYVVFSRGLEEAVFEDAVGAFAAAVPEPASLVLLMCGCAAPMRRRAA